MDDCSFEIELPHHKTEEERRIKAQKMLIFYQKKAAQEKKRGKSLQKQQRERENDEGSNDKGVIEADLPSCQPTTLLDKDSLLILEGLSLGKRVSQIYKENYAIHYYPKEKLKNAALLILLRLSKIMIGLLPIQPVPTPKQFKEKFFKNNQMLHYYHCQGLDLCSTFSDLLFINNWQKKNKEYLMRGYSHDYLPEDIKQRLAPISAVFNQIKEIQSHYQHFLESKQKHKASQTQLSTNKAKGISVTVLQGSLQQ